jgi:regulatory protein
MPCCGVARFSQKPDSANLQQAALAHLARYATTRAGLLRALLRRIARWARAAEGESEAIARTAAAARTTARAVVERLAESGLVNDATFATARARRLARSGSSRRSITAHLMRRGVGGTDLVAALPDDPAAELTAALTFARKHRIGPFRGDAPPEADARRRELAALARAGYPAAIARTALAMPRAEAEMRLLRVRQSPD